MNETSSKAYIFGSIFALSNRLQILGDKMDEKLTVKQWLLLAGILKSGEEAPTVSTVAGRIGSSRQNVKKMALILEKEGFLSLNPDPEDGRMLRISPTPACLAHLKNRDRMEQIFIETLFSGFDGGELQSFAGAIAKLERNVREMGKIDSNEE